MLINKREIIKNVKICKMKLNTTASMAYQTVYKIGLQCARINEKIMFKS